MSARLFARRPLGVLGPLLRHKSTAVIVPAICDVRQLAQPIAFVAVKGWDDEGVAGWTAWAKQAAKGGYTSLLVQVDPEGTVPDGADSSAVLEALSAELSKILSSPETGTPFPPLLISSDLSTLLAQTYVSSHPLSALVLHSPTLPTAAHQLYPKLLPTPLQEFDFEPNFPVAIMRESGADVGGTRLEREFGDEMDGEVRNVTGGRGKDGWKSVLEWMDENGL